MIAKLQLKSFLKCKEKIEFEIGDDDFIHHFKYNSEKLVIGKMLLLISLHLEN